MLRHTWQTWNASVLPPSSAMSSLNWFLDVFQTIVYQHAILYIDTHPYLMWKIMLLNALCFHSFLRGVAICKNKERFTQDTYCLHYLWRFYTCAYRWPSEVRFLVVNFYFNLYSLLVKEVFVSQVYIHKYVWVRVTTTLTRSW